jgi:hypothetical protein
MAGQQNPRPGAAVPPAALFFLSAARGRSHARIMQVLAIDRLQNPVLADVDDLLDIRIQVVAGRGADIEWAEYVTARGALAELR